MILIPVGEISGSFVQQLAWAMLLLIVVPILAGMASRLAGKAEDWIDAVWHGSVVFLALLAVLLVVSLLSVVVGGGAS